MHTTAGKTEGKPAITEISCLFSGKNIHIKSRRLIFRKACLPGCGGPEKTAEQIPDTAVPETGRNNRTGTRRRYF